MFLKCSARRKNGKEHRSWSIVESRRLGDGRCVQRHVLYLGEINDSQRTAWQKSIKVLEHGGKAPVQMAIFPEDRAPRGGGSEPVIHVKLNELELHRPRQWGGCWLALELWRQLGLDTFWRENLSASREGTRWDLVLTVLVVYRLLDPGSEWRLHRQWFERTALSDLLDEDFRLAVDDTLYRCHDKLLKHKEALFVFLRDRWRDLFGAKFDVLLYDLTSTYFECDVPDIDGLRRFGYSRDKRGDCVQVVVALIVTPEGFPVGYEVFAGNTADSSTLRQMLAEIKARYGKAEHTWLMDRGIPTEEVLEEMRASNPPIRYLVGTPKGRLSKLESALAQVPWQTAREGIEVKLVKEDDELYVLAKSEARISKERGMRRRRLKKLWKRLEELQKQKPCYEALLQKIGAAKGEAGRAAGLIDLVLPDPPATKMKRKMPATFTFSLNKEELRKVRRREGRYLLRSNLVSDDPAALWQQYMILTQVEEAFKNLKGDLALRPVYHHKDTRIQAHIFIAFLSYCLHVTLRQRLHTHAPGLTPRAALGKFAAMQMIDVHLPTTDNRKLILSRYTQPDTDCRLLLQKLKLTLPDQPPPKISSKGEIKP
jgi:transposase